MPIRQNFVVVESVYAFAYYTAARGNNALKLKNEKLILTNKVSKKWLGVTFPDDLKVGANRLGDFVCLAIAFAFAAPAVVAKEWVWQAHLVLRRSSDI